MPFCLLTMLLIEITIVIGIKNSVIQRMEWSSLNHLKMHNKFNRNITNYYKNSNNINKHMLNNVTL